MKEQVLEQMYIVSAYCYKCNEAINVAMIKSALTKRNRFCGPEAFTEEEKKTAENHGVFIQNRHSYTKEEAYEANTCPHCDAYIGQHFLFTDYFAAALNGDYKYEIVELPSIS